MDQQIAEPSPDERDGSKRKARTLNRLGKPLTFPSQKVCFAAACNDGRKVSGVGLGAYGQVGGIYLECHGDLVSRLIAPTITRTVTLLIPSINLLTKSP